MNSPCHFDSFRIGYHPDRRWLDIQFHSGAVRRFRNVPPITYRQLLASTEPRFFYNRNIKWVYPCTHLGVQPVDAATEIPDALRQ